MRYTMGIMALLVGIAFVLPETAPAQQQGLLDYQDPSQRRTRRSDREDRQKREAEEAKKKAEEERRRKEREDRRNRWQQDRDRRDGRGVQTSGNDRGTTRSGQNRSAGRERERGPATAPVTSGAGSELTTREVTEVMLDAIKTRHVQFDPQEARENPGMILLNAPKSDPAERKRAAESVVAQPL